MKDQHKHIKGYRDFDQNEVDRINAIKATGERIGAMVEALEKDDGLDQRWVAIGKTHLQQGFMALVRAVAKPDGF